MSVLANEPRNVSPQYGAGCVLEMRRGLNASVTTANLYEAKQFDAINADVVMAIPTAKGSDSLSRFDCDCHRASSPLSDDAAPLRIVTVAN
jgi:hypothetical protein